MLVSDVLDKFWTEKKPEYEKTLCVGIHKTLLPAKENTTQDWSAVTSNSRGRNVRAQRTTNTNKQDFGIPSRYSSPGLQSGSILDNLVFTKDSLESLSECTLCAVFSCLAEAADPTRQSQSCLSCPGKWALPAVDFGQICSS